MLAVPWSSFPQASLSEDCSLLGTDTCYVCGQSNIQEYFGSNGGNCLFTI